MLQYDLLLRALVMIASFLECNCIIKTRFVYYNMLL